MTKTSSSPLSKRESEPGNRTPRSIAATHNPQPRPPSPDLAPLDIPAVPVSSAPVQRMTDEHLPHVTHFDGRENASASSPTPTPAPRRKHWMAPSQRETGVNTDHLDAEGLWGDKLMAQGRAWKLQTEARDKKTKKWLHALRKTAEQKGMGPIAPKHASLAQGNEVVAEKRQATRSRLHTAAHGGVANPEGGTNTVTGEQAAKARQIEALVMMKGGSKVGAGSEFWTDYGAGSKDAAQKRAKDRGTGGTVELSKGGGWLDGSRGTQDQPGIPWNKLVQEVGMEGAKYIWDMNSIDFAEGATGEATFTAPTGPVDMSKTWGSIERPILEARLGRDAIKENRLTPEQVAEFRRNNQST